MGWFTKKESIEDQVQSGVRAAIEEMRTNASNDTFRSRISSALSGGYDGADTLHNIYEDFGYPEDLTFDEFWNMYRRFGIAKNVVELPVDTGWISPPEIDGSEQFNRDIKLLIDDQNMWQRLKGLDTRQRVGRYAGMFMRVRDGLSPDKPIEGKLSGLGSLVQMIPLYESQLDVVSTDQDPMSDTYGQPTMYQFVGTAEGNRNEDDVSSFNIHPDRVIISAEGADNGGIYGIPALEASFNSLMDLRKIIGAGGEGFYKNAAQSVVFNLKEGASAKGNKDLLDSFNEQFDEFSRNRSRRAMWTPGMESNTLESNLADPKNHFMNALYDVSASCKIPGTIIIGQQTGRLASSEDSRHFLSLVQSRRENFMSEMVSNVIDWMMERGILPFSDYEIEWDDLLSTSQEEKLLNADRMAEVNLKQFNSGGSAVFDSEEIREAADYETEEDELPSEDLDLDEDEE